MKKIHIYRETVIDVIDGESRIHISHDDNRGASMLESFAQQDITYWEYLGVDKESFLKDRGAKVQSVDLSRFIQSVNPSPKVLVIKMDVEGLEFKIVPNLLVSGLLCNAASAFLAVEWHFHATLFPFKEFDNLGLMFH